MSDAFLELDAKRNDLENAVAVLGIILTAADNNLSGEREIANALYFVFDHLYDLHADISKLVDELLEERRTNEQINSIQ